MSAALGFAANVYAVVPLYLLNRNLAVHKVPYQSCAVALSRFTEPATARCHDFEALTAHDTIAELARYFFRPAALSFEKECAEAAVAAVVKPERRECGPIAAHVDARAFGQHCAPIRSGTASARAPSTASATRLTVTERALTGAGWRGLSSVPSGT